MDIAWDLNARSFFDQLDPASRSRIIEKISSLGEHGGSRDVVKMHSEPGLFRLAVSPDFRVIFSRSANAVRIVDIIRRSQFDYFQRPIRR